MTEQWQTSEQKQPAQAAPQPAQPTQPAPQATQPAPQPVQHLPETNWQIQPEPKKDFKDNFLWIILATVGLYVFLSEILSLLMFTPVFRVFGWRFSPEMYFVVSLYLTTLGSFLFVFVYTRFTKKNRPIFDTFLLGYENNTIPMLLLGILVGFAMNFFCIAAALLHGDIKLYLTFTLNQIPFYIFALFCVWVQSSSEELWCRGFMYERLLYRYPVWVAVVVNGVFFGLLHTLNPGVSVLPIVDIILCGLSFSLAKWYTKSIWFPMGIHTGWNFTQNFLFGLPNSGLVSEASIFSLDAASARDTFVYNVAFGVEGAWPGVFIDAALGIFILVLAYQSGRIGELFEKKGQSAE